MDKIDKLPVWLQRLRCQSCHRPMVTQEVLIGVPEDNRVPFWYMSFGECPHCFALWTLAFGLN